MALSFELQRGTTRDDLAPAQCHRCERSMGTRISPANAAL